MTVLAGLVAFGALALVFAPSSLAATGDLTQKAPSAGCIANVGSPGGCTDGEALGGAFSVTGINAVLAPSGSGGGANDGSGKARINRAKVSGPRKLRMGRRSTYKVKIGNAGNTKAKGVKVKVSGRGVKARKNVGKIAPGKVRKVKVRLKPRKRGKVRLKFKMTSRNAGRKTIKKKVTVKK